MATFWPKSRHFRWLSICQKQSEKVFTSLKQYRDFAKSIRQDLGKISKLDLTQDPKKMLAATTQKLSHLNRDIRSGRIVNFEAISQSASSLIESTKPLQKEITIKTQSYIRQQTKVEQEITRQNEEFVLSILLMVVSAGLIVSMIWFVG